MKKTQKGVAIVEFALILPWLLLLSIITIEFGRAIWEYNALTKSVRDAARYLSLKTPGAHIAEARNLMIYGKLSATDLSATESPLAIGLTAANVPDPTWQTAGTDPVINTVTVRIHNYEFKSMFSSVFGFSFGTLGTIRYAKDNDITATMRAHL